MEERSFVGVLILLLLCATGCSEGQSSLALDDAGRPTESLPVADISDGVPAVRDVWGSEVIMIDVVAETTPVDERDPVVDAASVPDSESGDTSVDAASVLDSDSEDTKDADGAEEEIVAATFPGCASPIVIDGQALPATLLPVPNMEFGILATTSCPWSPNYSDAWDAPVRDSFVFDAPVAGIFAFAVQAASCEPFFYVGDQCEKWTDSACGSSIGSAGTGPLWMSLSAGDRVYVAVGPPLKGDLCEYVLQVSGPCIPHCDGAWCHDGCGGQCTCNSGSKCDGSCACVPLGPGDGCANAIEIDPSQLPTVVHGNTNFGVDMFDISYISDSLCTKYSLWYTQSLDKVYSFTPLESGRYTFDTKGYYGGLSPDYVGPFMYLMNDCTLSDCVAATIDLDWSPSIVVDIEAGSTVWLLIEAGEKATPPNEQMGSSFTIHVSEPCFPDCSSGCGPMADGCEGYCACEAGSKCVGGTCVAMVAGDSCDSPLALSLNTELAGNFESAPTVVPETACWGQKGMIWNSTWSHPTRFFDFIAPKAGVFEFVALASSYIYLEGASTCEPEPEQCLASHSLVTSIIEYQYPYLIDSYSKGAGIFVDMAKGERAVVAAYVNTSNDDAGQITWSMEVSQCFPMCDGVCGGVNNWCGGSCDSCPPKKVCEWQECKPAEDNDTCDDPMPIVAEYYQGFDFDPDGNGYRNYLDQYIGCALDEGGTPIGAGLVDMIFSFVPETSGTYGIETNATPYQSAAAISVQTTCGDINSCISGGAGSFYKLEFEAAAGVPYYIIVEANEYEGIGEFNISLYLIQTDP